MVQMLIQLIKKIFGRWISKIKRLIAALVVSALGSQKKNKKHA